jgi:hypothetical protein
VFPILLCCHTFTLLVEPSLLAFQILSSAAVRTVSRLVHSSAIVTPFDVAFIFFTLIPA